MGRCRRGAWDTHGEVQEAHMGRCRRGAWDTHVQGPHMGRFVGHTRRRCCRARIWATPGSSRSTPPFTLCALSALGTPHPLCALGTPTLSAPSAPPTLFASSASPSPLYKVG